MAIFGHYIFDTSAAIPHNGMLCHTCGGAVILFSLEHFIAPALDLMGCLPSWQRREAIKGLNSRREQWSAAKRTIIWGRNIFLLNCGSYWIWGPNQDWGLQRLINATWQSSKIKFFSASKAPQNLAGPKICSKIAWREKFNLTKAL